MEHEDYRSLPIPQWLDLSCPRCEYPLRGLPEHRCPECGAEFRIDDLVTPTTPLRPPRITPETRPVPAIGLHCGHCDTLLDDCVGDRCPACGYPFDVAEAIPQDPWVDISAGLDVTEARLIFARLRDDGIPCFHQRISRGLEPVTGEIPSDARGVILRVRRDYYLDALHVISTLRAPDAPAWQCPQCGEEVPGNFEICWKCLAPRETPAP